MTEFELDDLDLTEILGDGYSLDKFNEHSLTPLESEEVPPVPTELRISTITAICKTNVCINLANLIEHLHGFVVTDENSEGIITAKYGNTHIGQEPSKKGRKNKKFFYNQITIILRIMVDKDNFKNINMKIFNNGNFQLTGLKKEQDGHKSIKIVISYLNSILKSVENIFTFKNPQDSTINYTDFDVVLINTDFCARFKIKRDNLHKILVNQYQIFCTYEPCIYPGVKSGYYWNEDYKDYPNKGICYCTKNCNGKGRGSGNGQCKKVTIAIFQSGNVIITGARTYEQINDSYNFINSVFRDNFIDIKRNPSPLLFEEVADPKKKEIIYLKKSDLVFKNKKIFF